VEFLPLAQEAGLLRSIDEWVLRTACAQNKDWQALTGAPLRIAVNVSNSLFREKTFEETVVQSLRDCGLEPHHLELELTETVVLQHAEAALSTLKAFQEMGIHLSIDDFGTGYSSLSYLQRLPIKTLKIDQSFVKNIATDADNAAITRAIITMAHSLNLGVIAEGVETDEQLAVLRALGCDELQGYLFSPPLPADAMTKLLQSQRHHRPGDGPLNMS
jgi:EAL domain-containing protein (putative c-di-GMP-specific phosphodiesterase class I)